MVWWEIEPQVTDEGTAIFLYVWHYKLDVWWCSVKMLFKVTTTTLRLFIVIIHFSSNEKRLQDWNLSSLKDIPLHRVILSTRSTQEFTFLTTVTEIQVSVELSGSCLDCRNQIMVFRTFTGQQINTRSHFTLPVSSYSHFHKLGPIRKKWKLTSNIETCHSIPTCRSILSL